MASIGMHEHHKVIVLGAGITGISAAKTYLDIDPSVDLLIVDRESSIGGVWSAERIYPGLYYEVPPPLLDFTDLDMCQELGIEQWSDVTGYQVNEFMVRLDSQSIYNSADETRSDMLESLTLSGGANSTPWLRKLREVAVAGRFLFIHQETQKLLRNH